MRKILLILSALTFGFSNPAYSDFYSLDLQGLNGESGALNQFDGKTLLVVLFEPDCTWCHKQMRVFNKVTRECNASLQPLAIGINGQKLALKKELRRSRVQFPALKASASWLEQFDDIPATPWNLVISEQGELIAQIRGYIEYERIQKAFPNICAA